MTIRITGDGPKITATGSGSTVLVEISTGQHDPGSFSGVHNDLTGRSTTGAHVGTAVSIDPTGFAGNLDGTITNAQLLAAAVDDLTTGGGGGGVALGETSTTAYRGDRGKTAYDHSQVVSGNPHGTTAADVGADPAGTAAGLVDDLSGVSNQATARTNLGLGTAATAATGDFAATSHTHTGTQVTVDASGFNGNLTTSDDTLQEVAQKLDDLTIPAAGIADPGGANDDFLQRKSGAWTNRTVAQVKTDLGIADRNYYIDNVWYLLSHSNDRLGGASGYTPGTNAMAFWLLAVERTIQVDGLWFYLQATAASSKMRFGIWAPSATTGLATGSPLVTSAEVDASASTGYKSQTFTPVTLQPGTYWAGIACVGTATYRTWNAVVGVPPIDMGGPDSSTSVYWSFNSPWTYDSGALPDVSGFTYTAQAGATIPTTAAPYVRWRVQVP